jgi:gamma-glutamyltranspeptidase/glutathione hydrolase
MQKSELVDQIGWKAYSKTGIVAAGGAEAVAAGIDILEQGGNAADSAAATLFALMICDHGYCSIGGEVPVMIYDVKTQKVKVLSGQGGAPLSKDAIDWYMRNGIPEEGDIKVAPVPSVVDCCLTLLKMYGTKSFEDIVAPTLALLDAGNVVWHPRLAVTLRKMITLEQTIAGSREEKIQSTCDLFYGRNNVPGDIADDLEAFYIERGGFLRKEDLAAHKTRIEDPITVNYRGYTVCKCGPWTQGPYLCEALRLLEGFDLKAMGYMSSTYIHVIVEAIKLAMADRDEYYGDPNFVEVPLQALLSDEYTKIRQPLIEMDKASQEVRPGDPYKMEPIKDGGVFRPGVGGTTNCLVADRWGNIVVATPSANVFPGKHEGGKAGVTFGNRLRSFNTTPGHPNCIEPGKRPRITLTPTIVLKGSKPILAISVEGGDVQDQVTLKLLLDFIEFNILPEQAVIGPRFATTLHQDSFNPNLNRQQTYNRSGSLIINEPVGASVCEELVLRGHHLELRGAGSPPIGSPVMLYVNQEKGELHAAGDPAAHRHAAGL